MSMRTRSGRSLGRLCQGTRIRVRGADDLVAEPAQAILDVERDDGFVLDDQDARTLGGVHGSAPSDRRVRPRRTTGKVKREPGPGVALDRRGPSQLPHERRDQPLPERPGMLLAIRQRRQPDAVVGHDERRGAVGAVERDA